MHSPSIRASRGSDAFAIDSIAYTAALHHFEKDPHQFAKPDPACNEASKRFLAMNETAITFVAEIESSVVVGFVYAQVTFETRPMFVSATIGKIETIAVSPEWRNHGIGTSLLHHAEAWLATQGCTEVRLSVWACNEHAIKLYQQTGYVQIALSMSKQLRADKPDR